MLITVPELIGQSWKLYWQHWRALKPYMWSMFVPTFLLAMVGVLGLFSDGFLPVSRVATTILVFLAFLLVLVFTTLILLTLLVALKQLAESGTVPRWRDAWSLMTSRLLSVIWASILSRLAVCLAALAMVPSLIFLGLGQALSQSSAIKVIILAGTLLGILGLIITLCLTAQFSLWYRFTTFRVLFEGEKGWAAVQSSKRLVKGRWWGILWRVWAPSFVFGVFVGLILLLISLPFISLPYGSANITLTRVGLEVLHNILGTIPGSIFAPLVSLPITLLYLQAKQVSPETKPSMVS